MSLPIASDLKSLKFNFRGRPFYRGTKTVDLRSLAINLLGLPFAGIDVEQSDQTLTVPAGVVHVSGKTGSLVTIVTCTAEVSFAGTCVSAGVIAGVTMIDAPPAVVVSGGSAAVYGWIGIISEPGTVAPGGSVSSVVIVVIPYPAPGSVTSSGSAVVGGPIAILSGSKKLYECVLSADGYDNTIVPISSFTSRQRAGDPSYSEVIVPGLQYLTDVLDRQSGTFTVAVLMVKNGVTLQREVLFETEISAVNISGNDREQQMMISGYRTSEADNVPAVVPVSGINYRSTANGRVILRKPEPDLYLRPGDTLQYDGDEFTVELITFSHSVIYGSSMEISG